MALLTFPVPTFNGQLYPVNPLPGENQYRWSATAQTWVLLGPATGVNPDTYGDGYNVGQFAVDAQGKITFAQNVPIASSAGGTVTSVATGTGLTGGPITGAGTVSLLPATSSVIGGVYPDGSTITVGGSGQISVINGGGATLQQVTTNGATTTDVITIGGLIANGDLLPGAHETHNLGSPTAAWNTLYCKNTSIYLGPYKLSVVGGQLTIDGTVTGSGTVTDVTAGVGLSGGVITTSGTINLAPATTSTLGGVIADGTSILISPAGVISAVGDGTGTVTAVTAGTGLTGGTITTSGTIDLADTTVSPGSYTNANITVDAQGRLSAASSGTTPVTSVTASDGLSSSGGATPNITLDNTTVMAGSYTNASITVDSKGRITAASSGSGGGVTSVSGTAPISVTAGSTPTVSINAASTTQPGAVQLNDSVASTSTSQAATANAVKTVHDVAIAAMPLSGGTFTGGVTFNTQPTYATGVNIGSASKVTYNNATSGLTATEVQGAIDEVVAGLCVGTVTSVGTGTGLSGGAITTSGTISLNEAGPASLGGVLGVSNGSTSNVALGNTAGALFSSTVENVAIGDYAMASAPGSCNIAIGPVALGDVSGSRNVGIGSGALLNATAATNNVAIGYQAFSCLTTGCNNTEIGANNGLTSTYSPPFLVTNQCNRLVLGSTATTNAYVQVNWTVLSDERDKTEIQPIALGLDFVSQLEPISYRFKESRDSDIAVGTTRYGFSAQKVLKAEGDIPVIVDTEDPDKLKITDSNLIPVLVKAIQDLKIELDDLKRSLR